ALVVDANELDRLPAQLAALFLDVQPEAVLDRGAQRRVGSGVRQHETDLHRLALRRGTTSHCRDDRRRGQLHCVSPVHRTLLSLTIEWAAIDPPATAPDHSANDDPRTIADQDCAVSEPSA